MAIVRWKPKRYGWNAFHELEEIHQELNKLFNFPLMRAPEKESTLMESLGSPTMDVYDSKDNIMVKAELPGMNKDDIDVSVHGNILMVKGEKKKESEVREKDTIRSERFYGSFNRSITLPAYIDESRVSAIYKNGVLELTLPKKEEEKTRQIKIEVK